MKIEEDKKVDVLLAALGERYTSLHNIRERVESTGLWAIGLSLGAGGWLLQSGVTLSLPQKAVLLAGVAVAFIALRFLYLADLRKGFCGQQRAAVRIEHALQLFSKGVFDDTDEPIYPEKWQHAGTKKTDGKFFDAAYGMLYVSTAFLVASIALSGVLHSTGP